MSSRAQSRDLPRLLPYNFYAAILDEILRFAALSQDDRVECYPERHYVIPSLLPYNFYAAILDKILRFAALSHDDGTEVLSLSLLNLSAKPCRSFAINQGPFMSLLFSD